MEIEINTSQYPIGGWTKKTKNLLAAISKQQTSHPEVSTPTWRLYSPNSTNMSPAPRGDTPLGPCWHQHGECIQRHPSPPPRTDSLTTSHCFYSRSPFLNDKYRLAPPAGMESYFLSHRRRTNVLVGHWLWSLRCVQVQLFGQDAGDSRRRQQSAFVAAASSLTSVRCVRAFKRRSIIGSHLHIRIHNIEGLWLA